MRRQARMDVHPGLKVSRGRLQETADFLRDLLRRLECIAGKNRAGCPADLAPGAGTGFTLVTDHIPEFAVADRECLATTRAPAWRPARPDRAA